jgi:hypothetical protein
VRGVEAERKERGGREVRVRREEVRRLEAADAGIELAGVPWL